MSTGIGTYSRILKETPSDMKGPKHNPHFHSLEQVFDCIFFFNLNSRPFYVLLHYDFGSYQVLANISLGISQKVCKIIKMKQHTIPAIATGLTAPQENPSSYLSQRFHWTSLSNDQISQEAPSDKQIRVKRIPSPIKAQLCSLLSVPTDVSRSAVFFPRRKKNKNKQTKTCTT